MSGKTHATRIHKNLWLYKQRGSRNWYARVTFGGVTKAKSTGTVDLKLAADRAEQFFLERVKCCAKGEEAGGGGSNTRRFDKLADDFLESKRQDLSEREWRNLRNLVTAPNGPAACFHGRDVGDVTTDSIRRHLRFAEQYSNKGKLSPHTLKRHIAAVSGILRLAAERQLIPAVPPMPRIKVKDAPRSWFTDAEYPVLCDKAHKLGQQAERQGDCKAAADWFDLGDLIAFLVNTFARPGEWKHLRHRHVTAHRSGPTPHLLIALEHGKTGSRIVASMPSALKVYDRIVARNGRDPDDHLFLPRYGNRQTGQEKAGRLFRQLLDKTGLRFDAFGRPRTLYCLRHSALMLRLLKSDGLDLLTLAKAAGTSVPMLERFYLSHLAPAMKLADLQSFKARTSA